MLFLCEWELQRGDLAESSLIEGYSRRVPPTPSTCRLAPISSSPRTRSARRAGTCRSVRASRLREDAARPDDERDWHTGTKVFTSRADLTPRRVAELMMLSGWFDGERDWHTRAKINA